MRRLSSLTPDELTLLEEVGNACRIPSWKLVAYLLDDAAYVFEGHEMRRLDEYLQAAYLRIRARSVFRKIMAAPGMHIAQVKRKEKE